MALSKFPCLNCPDRKPACQSRCEKYLAAKAEHDELVAVIRKAKRAENDIYEYNRSRAIATKKRIRGKDV